MANAFWGITGFFIVLEIAFALAVTFSGGTKDDKQCVKLCVLYGVLPLQVPCNRR